MHKRRSWGQSFFSKTSVICTLQVRRFFPGYTLNVTSLERVSHSSNEETLKRIIREEESPLELPLKMPFNEAKQFAMHVLSHRKITKLLNTYVYPLKSLIVTWPVDEKSNEASRFNEKRCVVRPTWVQIGTGTVIHFNPFSSFSLFLFQATGRLSCKEPNFQNIPKPKDAYPKLPAFRTVFSTKYFSDRELKSEQNHYFFILSDFTQIEMRVLAFLSGDKQLMEGFMQSSTDFFDHLAEQWTIQWENISLISNCTWLMSLS
jgi:hypothetical protein